jgi:hypothetical protein
MYKLGKLIVEGGKCKLIIQGSRMVLDVRVWECEWNNK